jgi:hypothetical protein
MSEEKVSLIVQYIVSGQEQMKQIDSDLDKLSSKTDASTKATTAQGKAQTSTNLALNKMIPGLEQLNPMLAQFGIGALLGAGGLGAMAIEMMHSAQDLEKFYGDVAILGATTNEVSGGPIQNFYDTLNQVVSIAQKYGVTTASVTSALTGLENKIPDTTTDLELLAKALQISHDTGIPLQTVVDDLTSAYLGQNTQLRTTTGGIIAGDAAVTLMTSDLEAQATPISGLNSSYSNLSSRGMEDLKTGFGALGEAVLKVVEVFPVMVAQAELQVGALIDFLQGVNWDAMWGDIGAAWSRTWQASWSYIKGDWDRMASYLGNVDWSSLWNSLGTDWSKIWRGAVNIVIDVINGAIDLMDKIQVNIPSWVPIFGGDHFGINISDIPLLANGGTATTGGSAIVGENGPELIDMQQGATVTPLSGGGAGGQTINLYLSDGTPLATWFLGQLDSAARLRGAF